MAGEGALRPLQAHLAVVAPPDPGCPHPTLPSTSCVLASSGHTETPSVAQGVELH